MEIQGDSAETHSENKPLTSDQNFIPPSEPSSFNASSSFSSSFLSFNGEQCSHTLEPAHLFSSEQVQVEKEKGVSSQVGSKETRLKEENVKEKKKFSTFYNNVCNSKLTPSLSKFLESEGIYLHPDYIYLFIDKESFGPKYRLLLDVIKASCSGAEVEEGKFASASDIYWWHYAGIGGDKTKCSDVFIKMGKLFQDSVVVVEKN